jgi:hypothetical protein
VALAAPLLNQLRDPAAKSPNIQLLMAAIVHAWYDFVKREIGDCIL